MSVPVAAGMPDLGRQGAAFIPEIFLTEVNVKYYASSQIPEITNSRGSGKIEKVGDTFYLPQRPDITWSTVAVGEGKVPENPSSTAVKLQVNRLLEYNFLVWDANKSQSDIDIGMEGTTDVSLNLDGVLQGIMYQGLTVGSGTLAAPVPLCAATNQGATAGAQSGIYNMGTPTVPLALTPSTMISFITAFRSVISEANKASLTALTGVWCVIPEALRYGLINSDVRKAMEMGDGTSILRTGAVGKLVDTTIFTSTLLYSLPAQVNGKTVFAVLAGNKDAINFAMQMKSAEKIRYAGGMADQYRGQVLWDFNLVKASALVVAFVTFSPT